MTRTVSRIAGRLLVGSLTWASSTAAAQDAQVVVVDPNAQPVSYALVQVANGVSRVTDDSGRIAFKLPPNDSLRFSARRIGFSPFLGWAARDSVSGVYRITLRPVATRVGEVRVVATRDTPLARSGFYDRMQRAQRGAYSARFFTPEEMDLRNPSKVTQILAGENMIRLTAYSTPGGRPGRMIIQGRSLDCAMTILLDGRRLAGTLEEVISGRGRRNDASLMSVDEIIQAHSVAAIEVYGSVAAAPAELLQVAGPSGCGIVAIWTGSRK